MTNKELVKGIEIPGECGKADLIDTVLIMYQDMGKEQCGRKYNIYITEEDFKDKKPFFTVVSNMYPTIVTYVNDEDPDGARVVDDVLYDEERIVRDGFSELSFIVANSITGYEWLYTTLEREEYLSITPKTVLKYDGEYFFEKIH